jgi:hypothetical protein
MTKTFTPEITAAPIKEEEIAFLCAAGPSESTIRNILNYSRNLEVRPSQLIAEIYFVKS